MQASASALHAGADVDGDGEVSQDYCTMWSPSRSAHRRGHQMSFQKVAIVNGLTAQRILAVKEGMDSEKTFLGAFKKAKK